jgi:hypothetical protein
MRPIHNQSFQQHPGKKKNFIKEKIRKNFILKPIMDDLRNEPSFLDHAKRSSFPERSIFPEHLSFPEGSFYRTLTICRMIPISE